LSPSIRGDCLLSARRNWVRGEMPLPRRYWTVRAASACTNRLIRFHSAFLRCLSLSSASRLRISSSRRASSLARRAAAARLTSASKSAVGSPDCISTELPNFRSRCGLMPRHDGFLLERVSLSQAREQARTTASYGRSSCSYPPHQVPVWAKAAYSNCDEYAGGSV